MSRSLKERLIKKAQEMYSKYRHEGIEEKDAVWIAMDYFEGLIDDLTLDELVEVSESIY